MTLSSEIKTIRSKVDTLPPNEFNYYIISLLAYITNEEKSEQYQSLITPTNDLVDALGVLFSDSSKAPQEKADELKNVIDRIAQLEAAAKPYRSSKIGEIISNMLGIACGLATGIMLGTAGAVVGSFYGLLKPLSGAWITSPGLGLLAGFGLGFLAGSRVPGKLFYGEFIQKMNFCMSSLERLGQELENKESHAHYDEETKNDILNTYYPDVKAHEREEAFNNFLKGEHQFQVCTITTGPITKQLKGFVGHHVTIRFKINGKATIPIEAGDRIKNPNFVDQYENPRQVSGQTLYEMLVLDKILQETHDDASGELKKIYEFGSNDCRNYADKILLGTGQEPTMISRFSSATDKLTSYKVVRPLFSFYSRTKEDELHCFIENKDDPKFKINSKTWAEWNKERGEQEAAEAWSGFAPQ